MSEPPLSSADAFDEPRPEPEPGDVAVRTVLPEEAGWRLDLFLTRYFPQYSRVLLRKAIQACGVEIDGKGGKPAYRLKPGQRVTFTLPELPRQSPIPEAALILQKWTLLWCLTVITITAAVLRRFLRSMIRLRSMSAVLHLCRIGTEAKNTSVWIRHLQTIRV